MKFWEKNRFTFDEIVDMVATYKPNKKKKI